MFQEKSGSGELFQFAVKACLGGGWDVRVSVRAEEDRHGAFDVQYSHP